MIDTVKAAFKECLDDNKWIDDTTRQAFYIKMHPRIKQVVKRLADTALTLAATPEPTRC